MTEKPFLPEVAIVTGAGRGIGRATAMALSSRGVAVALAARASSELASLEGQILETGGRALAVPGDVSVAASVEHLVREAERQLGPVDLLVNNAGIVERGWVVETSEESWDRVLDVNLKGPFLCTRAVLPGMIARRRGRVVNVSSISGTVGTAGLASYCASKWGLIGLTKAVAEEVREHDVHVFAVCPGSVNTEMLRKGLPGAEPRISPEAVASLIVYLAMEAPAAMTGAAVDIFG